MGANLAWGLQRRLSVSQGDVVAHYIGIEAFSLTGEKQVKEYDFEEIGGWALSITDKKG